MSRGQIASIIVTVVAAMVATAQTQTDALGFGPPQVALLAISAAGLTAAQMFLPKIASLNVTEPRKRKRKG